MFDRTMLYNVVYALAARDGREAVLFGSSFAPSRDAFRRSLAGTGFPELWFELPLAGDPWFDLHVLTASEQLDSSAQFSPETTGGCPEAFAWCAAQGSGVRQLSLSWDIGRGDVGQPAVQLLVSRKDVALTYGYLEAVGRADAAPSYREFVSSLPEGWFACYAGVFPGRAVPHLRVECIPNGLLQQAYAQDASLLEAHLRQLGLSELGDTLLPRCQLLAGTPFRLEFQFDVEPGGRAGATFGASLRFAPHPGPAGWPSFDPDGEAGRLMRQMEEWGLADQRWRMLADTAYAKRVRFGGSSALLFCYPAFVKLRWREGQPVDAKAYLVAGVQ